MAAATTPAPFRFLRDPLFLTCLVVYFTNRWLLKPYVEPHVPGTFFSSYVNDLICIPFWVPIILAGLRVARLRDEAAPRAHEVLIPLIVWSFMFEIWIPQTETFRGISIADPADILCYTLGAAGAAVYWRWRYGLGGAVVEVEEQVEG